MAVLSDPDRAQIWAEYQRELSTAHESASFTKAQLLAAVAAADQWINDNSAAYNAALPTAFRNNATPAQKARMLSAIVAMRFIRGT
jgi:hypothetical protein